MRHALAPAPQAAVLGRIAIPRLAPWATVYHALRAFASDGGANSHRTVNRHRASPNRSQAPKHGPPGGGRDTRDTIAHGANVSALCPPLAVRHALAPAPRAAVLGRIAIPRLNAMGYRISPASHVCDLPNGGNSRERHCRHPMAPVVGLQWQGKGESVQRIARSQALGDEAPGGGARR
jgi:hypothetical protein